MNLIAWSQNMTRQAAEAVGATLVSKNQLFEQADFLTIHVAFSSRTSGLIGAAELARMKPTARLINTSRGPICDTDALIAALKEGRLGYAGLDVYDKEPLPIDHPLRTCPNVILTPHIGYVTDENYRGWFPQIVENIVGFLDGKPQRVIG